MSNNDATFYQNPLPWEKLFTIFVRGDRLVIYPVLLFSLILFFFNRQYAIVFILVFLSLRFFIEIIYWLFQQFTTGQYRPYDYGLNKLSNNSIYIIYQLTSTFTCAFFLSCLIIYLDHVS